MIVTITQSAREAIRRRCNNDVVAAFDEGVVRSTKRMVTVDMPAVAWKILHGEIRDTVMGPLGGHDPQAPKSWPSALQRITRALNEIEHHPALRGLAVMGRHTGVIPVWPVLHDEWRWCPYPLAGSNLTILGPVYHRLRGSPVTVWMPDSVDGERLALENRLQLRFGVEVGARHVEDLRRTA